MPSDLTARNHGFRFDPVFWCGVGVYVLNRWVLKPHMPHNSFFHGHLNDILLVPGALPPVCFLYRALGLRRQKKDPTWSEIGLHLVIWSLFFEWLGPWLFHQGTRDRWDVVSYAIGAIIAGLLWNGLPAKQPRVASQWNSDENRGVLTALRSRKARSLPRPGL